MIKRARFFGFLAFFCVFAAFFSVTTAPAVQPDEILQDAGLEARARSISAGLRCLMCQNESIDESTAPVARDLRLLVRERLIAGDSDSAVYQYLVDRYGDFILLKPRFKGDNVILWLLPFVVLAIGFAVVLFLFMRKKNSAPPPLTDAEEKALKRILERKT